MSPLALSSKIVKFVGVHMLLMQKYKHITEKLTLTVSFPEMCSEVALSFSEMIGVYKEKERVLIITSWLCSLLIFQGKVIVSISPCSKFRENLTLTITKKAKKIWNLHPEKDQ